jgi:UDP-N-acetylmuramoyl-tripeptide--D-alanyl-D-alanine ligase
MQKVSLETLYEVYKKFSLVCTDTRNVKKDSLFFALKGGNFNGNEFAAQALEQGSAYAVVDEEKFCVSPNYLLVQDVLSALQKLAKHHRQQLKIPVLGITGSNGKTTSKELIATVLGRKFKTLATYGNLNNHIGVPLTLLSIRPEHEMAVIEMGANHLKEIEFLSSISLPDFGIITNIGKAHIEGFGSVENIAKGKSELYAHLRKSEGLVFLNKDNNQLCELAKGINSVTYGSGLDADFIGNFEGANPFVQLRLSSLPNKTLVKTQIIGKYNFDNCLAAACIGNYFGVEEKEISYALENYLPENNRSQVIQKGNNTILLDAYNANPSSMEVALQNFADMKAENKIAILGDMLELGTESEKEHQHIVSILHQQSNTKAILIGPLFSKVTGNSSTLKFDSSKDAAVYLSQHPPVNSTILIKGSRGIKLETLVDFI